MKVLLIIENLKRGGKERQFVELLKGLVKAPEISIHVVLLENIIEYGDFQETEVRVSVLSRSYLKSAIALYRICRNEKPNLIHSWGRICTLISIFSKVFTGVKLIDGSIRYAARFTKLSKKNLLARMGFLFADMVISNSRAGLKAHRLENEGKYRYIHNGFDSNRNKIPNFHGTKGLSELKGNKVVGTVANFLPSKDYKTLISAANILLDSGENICFVFVGNGPGRAGIEASIEPEKKDYFHFTGKRDDVESVISIFDIGILLSNTDGHAEGISNALIEMMSSGIPVIATRASGNEEVIEQNINGILVSPFNPSEVADKIRKLFYDPGFSAKLGRNARDTIGTRFSIQLMIRNYIRVYNELSG